MNYLLDTSTWINSVKEPETLPQRIRALLEDSDTNSFSLADISLLEASFLQRKGKVDFGMPFRDWLARALGANLIVLPITAAVAAHENGLPRAFQGDPADRLIAATAKAYCLTLMTPDPEIGFHEVVDVLRYKWRPKR
jgi:PIN domain nuclease of toxin-antitoxin system